MPFELYPETAVSYFSGHISCRSWLILYSNLSHCFSSGSSILHRKMCIQHCAITNLMKNIKNKTQDPLLCTCIQTFHFQLNLSNRLISDSYIDHGSLFSRKPTEYWSPMDGFHNVTVSFQVTRGSRTVAGFCIARWTDKTFLGENDEQKVTLRLRKVPRFNMISFVLI